MSNPHPKNVQGDVVDWTRRLVQSTADYSVFRITRDGNVASWNGGGVRIEDYQPEDIPGEHFSVLYYRRRPR